MHALTHDISILTAEHPAERRVLTGLIIALAVFSAAYLYCISASVLNVIARKEAVARAATLESSIGSLEQEYFASAASVTPSSGETLGLSPIADVSYVHRPSAVASAVSSDEI